MTMNAISLIKSNGHTSIASAAYIIAKVGAQIGAAWLPAHAEQFKTTADIIESAAIGYGLMAAGDASKSLSKTDADTKYVQKEDLPASAQSTTPKP